MSAIREINLGVSQLEEVVQQNAAASHELSGTSNDLASHSTSLQQKVDFFQLDTTGTDTLEGPAAPALADITGCGRRPPRPEAHRAGTATGQSAGGDGQHGRGPRATAGARAHARALPQTPRLVRRSGWLRPITWGLPQRGGVVVNLDDDDNFERFS